jgi:hypothetical protein
VSGVNLARLPAGEPIRVKAAVSMTAGGRAAQAAALEEDYRRTARKARKVMDHLSCGYGLTASLRPVNAAELCLVVWIFSAPACPFKEPHEHADRPR